MKTKSLLLLAAAVILGITPACNDDNDNALSSGIGEKVSSIGGTLPDVPSTKTSLTPIDENNLKTTWTQNDKVYVLHQYRVQAMTEDTPEASVVEFTAQSGEGLSTQLTTTTNDKYWNTKETNCHALYLPSQTSTVSDFSNIGFTMTNQDGTVSSLQKYDILYGTGTVTETERTPGTINMKHLFAAIRFNFTLAENETIKESSISINYEPTNSEEINFLPKGQLSYNLSDNTPTLTYGTEGLNMLSNLKAEKAEDFTNSNTYACFLMTPPNVTRNGTLTVSYETSNGTKREITKEVQNKTFEAGNVYAIFEDVQTPMVDFVEVPAYIDAHYVIQPFTIKANSDWTLEVLDENGNSFSNNENDYAYISKSKSNSGITDNDDKKNEITTVQSAGMWSYVNGYNVNKVTGSESNEKDNTITVYLLVRENNNETNRKLQLKLTNKEGQSIIKEITQYGYLKVNDQFAIEQIEEDESSAYGYFYKGSVTYKWKASISDDGFFGYIFKWLVGAFTSGTSWGKIKDVIVEYDTNVSQLVNENDGLTNTQNGQSNMVSATTNWALNYTYEPEQQIPTDISSFAIAASLKKNSLGNFSSTEEEQTAAKKSLSNDQIVWYLPAKEEMETIGNNNELNPADALNGIYWSSTAINNEENTDNYKAWAYSYDQKQSIQEDRSTKHNIRCARKINN